MLLREQIEDFVAETESIGGHKPGAGVADRLELGRADAVVEFAFNQAVDALGTPAKLGHRDEVAFLLDIGRG